MFFARRNFIDNSVVRTATRCSSLLVAALRMNAVVIGTALMAAFQNVAYSEEPAFSAKWVKAAQESRTIDFCGKFFCPEECRRVRFFISNKTASGLMVNGLPAAFSSAPELSSVRYTDGLHSDVTKLAHPGENELRFSCTSKSKTPEFILRGEVIDADGRTNGFFSCSKSFKASEKGKNNWMPVVEIADVRREPWYGYSGIFDIYTTLEERARHWNYCNEGFPEKLLASEPEDPTARIVYSGDMPGIEINGEVLPPIVFSLMEPQTSDARDNMVRHLRETGIRIICLDKFWPHVWRNASGRYDFTEYDRGMRRMLAIHPDAYFMISYRGGTSADACGLNVGELQEYAIKSDSREMGDYGGNPVAPSIASKVYRRKLDEFFKGLASFARSKPWGRRLIGIHMGWGGSGDGMPCGSHANPDIGKCMTEAFRKWLSEKYGTDSALQTAWGDTTVTLANAMVPDYKARVASGGYLRDLSDPRDRRVRDYYDCYHSEFEQLLIDFGEMIKRNFPGRLAGAYHAYTILGFEPVGNTARYGRLMKSPMIDYMLACPVGQSTDQLHRHIPATFHRHGKLSSNEADFRTHLCKLYPNSSGTPRGCFQTPEETRECMEKVIGNSLISGTGWHTLDFSTFGKPKWFDCPEILEPVRRGIELWRRFYREPATPASDIAVVLDPDMVWSQGSPNYGRTEVLSHALTTHALQTLNFSGFTYDLMSPEDYLASSRNYKATIFLNLFSAPENLREALQSRFRRNGTTAIWQYAPGIITEDGYSVESMKALTGMELTYRTTSSLMTVKLSDGGQMMPLKAAKPEAWRDMPRVHVIDGAVETLGTWGDDGTVAVARKRLGDGSSSVFLGLPCNRPGLWVKLLKDAGCHQFTPEGFYVRRNSRLLQVVSLKGVRISKWMTEAMQGVPSQAGEVPVVLDGKAKRVQDCFTGEIVAEGTNTFVLRSDGPRTWLLSIDQ